MRPMLRIGALVAVLAVAATGALAAGPPRLELAGGGLGAREAEGVFARALRAPGDSAALAGALGDAVARLQSEGWLDARAEGEWPDSARLVVRLAPGDRRRLASLAWDVPREDSAAFAAAAALNAGEWASPPRLTRALEQAVDAAVAGGYPYAQLAVTGWSADSAGLHVRFGGQRGPRVIVDAVRLEGLRATQSRFLVRAMGPLAGMPYDPAAANAATLRLQRLGLFESVEYAGLEGGADWSRGRLVWRVREARTNRFEGAVGVQGEAGVVGLARLDLGNLGGTGRAVALAWQSRGRGLADFSARVSEPMLLGAPVRAELSVAQQLQDTSYSRTRAGARLVAAPAGGDRLELGYEEDRVTTPAGAVRQAAYQNTTLALERDGRDDVRAPRRGTRARVAATQATRRLSYRPGLAPAAGAGGGSSSVLDVALEWHRPLAGRTGLALELRGTGRFGGDRVRADYERFALGGASTLRGQDEEALRLDRWALARSEWRWFVGTRGERLSLFWDHAEAETRVAVTGGGDRLERRSLDGVGFGLRLPAAGGFVDLDYGLEPGRGALEGKIHLQLGTLF